MATQRSTKGKPLQPGSTIRLLAVSIAAIALLFLFFSLISTTGFSFSSSSPPLKVVAENLKGKGKEENQGTTGNDKYLYWGYRIDCPGKHCDTCAGLGHQESSLRCALEEALYLQRTFVLPSRMCINPLHNKKGMLHPSNITSSSSEEGSLVAANMWMATSCAMDSLYDLDLISEKIPVILDNSKPWHHILLTSMKLGARGVAHVEGVNRVKLKTDSRYSNLLLLNRTASPLAWFVECKDRKNQSAITLPYSFLPSMAAKKLRDAAGKIKAMLGDYDALHVRRGDILKTRKDRFGEVKSLHPHVARDTRPEFILRRIAKWVPEGRTLYIASNERTPGFFSPLSLRYRLAYSANYSRILDPVVENNYQLFMIERLIMMGAKTFINTFKSEDSELSLTDDPKKNTKKWQKLVQEMEEENNSL
ncbi:hypothetical protein Dimus_002109 [Dionaea muscipula]